ncbi:hypothetical protein TNCV_3245491 [Trichonephila clavipes]|nr:hypothetical protein TNCV_3245491 [Trichonephila clavipes]
MPRLYTPLAFVASECSGRGRSVVKALYRGLPCHEFEPSTTKDPPCRETMHVKSVESSNVGVVWWLGEGVVSAQVSSTSFDHGSKLRGIQKTVTAIHTQGMTYPKRRYPKMYIQNPSTRLDPSKDMTLKSAGRGIINFPKKLRAGVIIASPSTRPVFEGMKD